MDRSFFTLLAFASATTTSFAQLSANHQMTTYVARRTVTIGLGGGSSCHARHRASGCDSRRVEWMWTDPAHVITNARSYRLASPLAFMNTAAKLDDGFLVGGISYSGSQPFILKTDNAGDMDWCYHIDGLVGNDQIIQLLGYGSDFTAYTYPGGTYSDRVYRLNGSAAGTIPSGLEMQATDGSVFRMYSGLATTGSELICGTGKSALDPTNTDVMMANVGGGGVLWMMLYDLGGTGGVEDAISAELRADGTAISAGYYFNDPDPEGFLLNVDPTGTVIWCKTYSSANGLLLNAVHELADGTLLAAGSDGSGQGVLLKLSTTGDPIWTKRYASSLGSDIFQRFHVNDLGGLKLYGTVSDIGLDPDGASCDFVDIAQVIAFAQTPVVTSAPLAPRMLAPSTPNLVSFNSVPEIAWIETCVLNAVEEQAMNVPLVAYPIPTSGMLWLGDPGQVAPNERIILRDITGKTLIDREYADGIDLTMLLPGTYLCSVPRTSQRVRLIKQ